MKTKLFLLIALFVGFSGQLEAQEVTFTANAPSAVELGETFKLSFSVTARGSAFRPPSLNAFDYSGPSSSTQQSTQIVNGKVTRTFSVSYNYYMRAKRTGKFTIGSASIKVDGKTYKTSPIQIEVVKGSGGNTNTPNNQDNTTESGSISGKDLYVALNLDKTSVYQGEQIIATINLYTRLDLSGFEDMKLPTYKGFWAQEIETDSNVKLRRQNIGGKVYQVGTLKRDILFPQKSGTLIIEPFTIDVIYNKRVRRPSFFDNGYRRFSKTLRSASRKIRVKPLPAGAPESFKGAVGKFDMKAELDMNQTKTNEPITLRVTVSGKGNIKLIDPIDIKFPTGFETFPPNITPKISNTLAGSSGSKTFEYLVMPRHAGDFTIPPLEFTYFDPQSGQYKTLKSQEFEVHVEKGDGQQQGPGVVSGMSKEDVKYIGSDIRYIKTKHSLRKKGEHFFGSARFYLAYLVAALLFVAVLIWRRKTIQRNADVLAVRNRRANKVSRKRLKKAAGFLKNNKQEEFYNEVLQALWGYLSDKLAIQHSELSRESAVAALEKHEVEQELTQNFIQVLDTCEYARYAPSAEGTQMDEVYRQASQIISKIEQKLK